LYLCKVIKQFVIKYKKQLFAIGLGAVAGGLYYYFVGCRSGNCLIASNPYVIIPYGALLGYLLLGSISNREKSDLSKNENV